MIWTDARITELTRLWFEGRTASEVAAAMRTTRNAVLGKVRRLGLERVRAKPKLRAVGAVRLRRMLPERRAAPEAARSILKLSDRACRWPLGEPQETGFRFCGREARSGKPYCDAHHARAHLAPRPRAASSPGEAIELQHRKGAP